MTTPLSEERLEEMRERLSQTEPLYYCQLTGSEVHSLLAEVERLRALERDHHYDLRTEVARFRARVAALEGVLRSVEWGAGTWAYDDDGGRMIPTCPRCLGENNYGHDDDCALDAALRGADE